VCVYSSLSQGMFFLYQVVLSTVVKNEVGLLGRTANIRTEHDVILRFRSTSFEVGLVESCREQFDVTTTAINVLFVLNRVRDNQLGVLVAEGLFELGGDGVESSVLCCLKSNNLVIAVRVELACRDLESSSFTRVLLPA